MLVWRQLNKKSKSKSQGQVHLRLALSALKNVQVATQEHRQLLKILLKQDIEDKQPLPYKWSGDFVELAEMVLTQHRAQTGLDENHVQLARWAEFCAFHAEHPINFQLIGRTLEKVAKVVQSGGYDDEEVRKNYLIAYFIQRVFFVLHYKFNCKLYFQIKIFWEAARKLMPSCLSCIKKIRRLMPTDKDTLTQLEALLR